MNKYILIVQASQANQAIQNKTNQEPQLNIQSTESVDDTEKSNEESFFASISTLVALIVSVVGLYKFVIERGYKIESIVINLTLKKDLPNDLYSYYHCDQVYYNHERKAIIDFEEKYLDVCINLFIPSNKREIDYVWIKKLVLTINNYVFFYSPQNGNSYTNRIDLINDGQEKYFIRLWLKHPCIMRKSDYNNSELLSAFMEPQNVRLDIKWYPQVLAFPLIGFLIPKKQEFIFENNNFFSESVLINIKSSGRKRINQKRKKNNG